MSGASANLRACCPTDAAVKHILSRENPHFKALKKLCQSGRERRKTGRIVLDGMHLIESLVASGCLPIEIVVSESGQGKDEIAHFLETISATQTVTLLADSLFDDLAPVETPSGILAVAEKPRDSGAIDLRGDAILLDGVQDPGNVGSILRTAAAAGFKQVLLSEDCAQVWSPKVLRAGMGAHFLLELSEAISLKEFLEKYRGLALLTTLDEKAGALYELDLRPSVAWIFGNEGQGVRPDLAEIVRHHARIPMPGACESLNVAAAAAICLFETVRQRGVSVKR